MKDKHDRIMQRAKLKMLLMRVVRNKEKINDKVF